MKIAIGSDHRGVDTKRRLAANLRAMGHEVADLGVDGTESVDYPDYAYAVGKLVGAAQAERGVLICGTSLGMCIAANKVHGVRAASCHDNFTAEMSRRHNDANVLCLSADLIGEELIDRIVRVWMETPFEGGRHARRVEKITKIEAEQCEKK